MWTRAIRPSNIRHMLYKYTLSWVIKLFLAAVGAYPEMMEWCNLVILALVKIVACRTASVTLAA